MPNDKRVKYSGPKKEKSNNLIETLSKMRCIEIDRHYAKKVPYCGLLRYTELDMRFLLLLLLVY